MNELKKKEEIGIDRWTPIGIQGIKEENNEPTGTLPFKKKDKFRVKTDASEHAIGEVLSQEQKWKWKPIVFLSRTIQPAERNYKIYDKELLAIVKALTKWRQYLLNAMEKFKV